MSSVERCKSDCLLYGNQEVCGFANMSSSSSSSSNDKESLITYDPPNKESVITYDNSATNHHTFEATREWREYFSGASSAFIAVGVTFPINKAMFRQQVYNIQFKESLRQLHKEGAMNLYRGVLSPLMMKVMSQSVMFGSYTQYARILHENSYLDKNLSKILGAVFAGVSEAILMPLERVQVLMQDRKYHARFRNTIHAFAEIRFYGLSEYYRGLAPILLRNCPGNIIFFTCRERIKDNLPKSWLNNGQSLISDFVSGACLGAFISTAFFPINVTKTHMQLKVGGSFLKFRTVFLSLWKERGLKGMFRGVHLNYTRSFLSWGIVNVTYETILQHLKTTW